MYHLCFSCVTTPYDTEYKYYFIAGRECTISADTGACSAGEYSLEGMMECKSCRAGFKCETVQVSILLYIINHYVSLNSCGKKTGFVLMECGRVRDLAWGTVKCVREVCA